MNPEEVRRIAEEAKERERKRFEMVKAVAKGWNYEAEGRPADLNATLITIQADAILKQLEQK
jgi:hypothetical protein